MPDKRVDILVVGSGLCGLAIATTAARRGFSVRCLGDGRPGASMANFGQLHSGAVYAPVFPDLAQACWLHRNRWRKLVRPAQVGEAYGHALFTTAGTVDHYREAWQGIGIRTEEVDPSDSRIVAAYPPPVAAFRILDLSVDLRVLHAHATALMTASGVPSVERQEVTLHYEPDSAFVAVDSPSPRADLIVLATGANTPIMLARAGIKHTLRRRRIAWGRYTGSQPTCLTYWLDGDLLAISPDSDGARIGLPGIDGQYGSSDVEYSRMRAALDQHRIGLSGRELRLQWGIVCEPTCHRADSSSLVLDLRDPPPGWSRAANLLVALPGKWTTAWNCAERVVDVLG